MPGRVLIQSRYELMLIGFLREAAAAGGGQGGRYNWSSILKINNAEWIKSIDGSAWLRTNCELYLVNVNFNFVENDLF